MNGNMNGSGGGSSSNHQNNDPASNSRKRLLEEVLRGIHMPAYRYMGGTAGTAVGPNAFTTLDQARLAHRHGPQAPSGGLLMQELPFHNLLRSTQYASGVSAASIPPSRFLMSNNAPQLFAAVERRQGNNMSAPSSLLGNIDIPFRSAAGAQSNQAHHQQERSVRSLAALLSNEGTIDFSGRLSRAADLLSSDLTPAPGITLGFSPSIGATTASQIEGPQGTRALHSALYQDTREEVLNDVLDDVLVVQDSDGQPMTKKPRLESNTNSHPLSIPLGIEEDPNWLSEFQCILRADLVEVVQQKADVGRKAAKAVSPKQIGIRCRWCVNVSSASRVCRSSAYPSSIRQLYQSYTMMVREHFGENMCTSIPEEKREVLQLLRTTRNAQGASDSKNYWTYAAKKIGMFDSDHGIMITEESRAAGRRLPPFGSPSKPSTAVSTTGPAKLLVTPSDMNNTSAFLFLLVSQTQMICLEESEKVAKRKTLPVGLEGIGCRYCCAVGRHGFSRRFPLRKRCLPEELKDMYCHIRRCPLCPEGTKRTLEILYDRHKSSLITRAGGGTGSQDGRTKDPNRDFYYLLWTRLGRTCDIKT